MVAVLPIFIQIRDMDLINSLWGVIFPLVAFGLPGTRDHPAQLFSAIPIELEDAAYIDGCTRIGFFRFILLPLARPALASVATLSLIAGWNEYFLPLLILNDPKKWPLPAGNHAVPGPVWDRLGAGNGLCDDLDHPGGGLST